MIDNKNTSDYWNARFGSGDWNEHGGQVQTVKYARRLVSEWHISPDFDGTVLDFGCALGDAIPVYKEALPKARFIGLDHSSDAVAMCRKTHGDIAEFIEGVQDDVPPVDVIVTSHTLEHITGDVEIAKVLLAKCKELYIMVPYREDPLRHEHVRMYDETRYQELGAYQWQVFNSELGPLSWGQFVNIHVKNLLRPLLGKKIRRRNRAIMYHFSNHD